MRALTPNCRDALINDEPLWQHDDHPHLVLPRLQTGASKYQYWWPPSCFFLQSPLKSAKNDFILCNCLALAQVHFVSHGPNSPRDRRSFSFGIHSVTIPETKGSNEIIYMNMKCFISEKDIFEMKTVSNSFLPSTKREAYTANETVLYFCSGPIYG